MDIAEIGEQINAILQGANALESELQRLEALKGRRMKKYEVYEESYREPRCVAVPKRSVGLDGSSQELLCQMMDAIDEMRMNVHDLAMKQNQMKAELNRIRGRLC
jgi:hypothetical protein